MTREEAIEILSFYQKGLNNWGLGRIAKAFDIAIEALSDRPRGEWIKKQVFNPELDKYVPFIECSVCGYEPYYGGSEPKFNYCANCGAKMRGGAE